MVKTNYYKCIETELVNTDVLKSIAQVIYKIKPHEDTIPVDENMFAFMFSYHLNSNIATYNNRTKGLLITVYKRFLLENGLKFCPALQLSLGYLAKSRSLASCKPVYEVGYKYPWERLTFYQDIFSKISDGNNNVLQEVLEITKQKVTPQALRKILYKPYKNDENPWFKIWI